jgi:hypothetical protein
MLSQNKNKKTNQFNRDALLVHARLLVEDRTDPFDDAATPLIEQLHFNARS